MAVENTTANIKILLRSGSSDYASLLLAGEAFYNKTNKKLYIGDGSTAISSLPYFLNSNTGVTLDTYQTISGDKCFTGELRVEGVLRDCEEEKGSNGSILTSTGNYVKWQGLKTINGQSMIGSGNIQIEAGQSADLSNYYTKDEVDNKIDEILPKDWVEITDEFYLNSDRLELDEQENVFIVYVKNTGDFSDGESILIGYFADDYPIYLKPGNYLSIPDVYDTDHRTMENGVFSFGLPRALGGAKITPVSGNIAYFVEEKISLPTEGCSVEIEDLTSL